MTMGGTFSPSAVPGFLEQLMQKTALASAPTKKADLFQHNLMDLG